MARRKNPLSQRRRLSAPNCPFINCKSISARQDLDPFGRCGLLCSLSRARSPRRYYSLHSEIMGFALRFEWNKTRARLLRTRRRHKGIQSFPPDWMAIHLIMCVCVFYFNLWDARTCAAHLLVIYSSQSAAARPDKTLTMWECAWKIMVGCENPPENRERSPSVPNTREESSKTPVSFTGCYVFALAYVKVVKNYLCLCFTTFGNTIIFLTIYWNL